MRLLPAAIAASLAFATLAFHAHAQQRLRRLPADRAPGSAMAMPQGSRIERDIAYGAHPRQRYDVYFPAQHAPGAPILFMVHGGGWRNGDKDNPGVAGDKARFWLAKGFVLVSTNYRLLPDADPLQQARDVADAVASVQRRAPRWQADPKRLVLMGHSAGAHLVALLGSAPALLAQAGALRPLGMVALDSAAMDVPALMQASRLPGLYRDAFGGDPAAWVAASPVHQLGRNALPMLLVCSTRRVQACRQARALQEQAGRLGVPAALRPEDLAHGDINRELGKPSAYTRAVADWIDHLAG